ncbi:MAG: methyl-accepting chemotaxis protein [Lachnospiraceae bacterium]|nr:methyl-accepting chemotaxis protein [Lachnospiraceae bacterium]
MKIKKMGTKLLLGILPPVVIGMIALALISEQSAQAIITEQMQGRMVSELNAQSSIISNEMAVISNTTQNLSGSVSNSYKGSTPYILESTLRQVVEENESILGCGIWFEPNVYKSAETYYGPYVYRDGPTGANLSLTYDYSNADYDYFNQEYYLMSKEVKEPVFTEPYYDEAKAKVVITCTAPMYNTVGNYIGCVTIDTELSTIQTIINEVKVGENGDAMLIIGDCGSYLSCPDLSKVEGGMSILDEENESLRQAGQTIMETESGETAYSESGETYRLYYETIPGVDWRIIIRIPESDMRAPIDQLLHLLTAVCIAAIAVSVLVIIIQVRNISKGLKKVHRFAETLAEGDFTVPPMPIKRADELGRMGRSLNAMYESNKDVLMHISEHAGNINASSVSLNEAADELGGQFEEIADLMNGVNEAMMSVSASTQEVNASAEEVSSSVNVLAGETEKSLAMAQEIKKRAADIEADSKASYDHATALSAAYEENLKKSIENAKVVESIGKLAEVISDIAGQINLLSLNASIEAARAGEAGRGFAVVATEIGKMAGDTSNAVGEIQKTVEEVKSAFDLLTADSGSLITFLKETVTPDYDKFVGVAKQYGADAVSIQENSSHISNMAGNIEQIMGEVAGAVQNIAESTQETADSSSRIMETVSRVSAVVEQVSKMSAQQEEIAGSLNEVVGKFKLD